MTVQPTRDQLRALASRAADDGYTGNDNYGQLTVSPAVLVAILDQLDQQEAELDSWMARAYEAEKRAWQAEARIMAVRDVLNADEHVTKHMGTLGQCRPDIPAIAHDTIRRALDT